MGHAERVWIYDLKSRQLSPMVTTPGNPDYLVGIEDVAWGADNTLYVSALKNESGSGAYLVALTMTDMKELDQFPAEVNALFFAKLLRYILKAAKTVTISTLSKLAEATVLLF